MLSAAVLPELASRAMALDGSCEFTPRQPSRIGQQQPTRRSLTMDEPSSSPWCGSGQLDVKPVHLAVGLWRELLSIGRGMILLPGHVWDAAHARSIRIQESFRPAWRPESRLFAVSRKARKCFGGIAENWALWVLRVTDRNASQMRRYLNTLSVPHAAACLAPGNAVVFGIDY